MFQSEMQVLPVANSSIVFPSACFIKCSVWEFAKTGLEVLVRDEGA